MTTIDDASLLAFFDGTLPPDEHSRVAQQIGTSPELTERMSMLHASELAYATAFDDQALPPLPAGLALNVDALIEAHLAKQSAQRVVDAAIHAIAAGSTGSADRAGHGAPADDDALIAHAANVHRFPVRASAKPREKLTWLAAAFVAGAFCWGIATHSMPSLNGSEPGVVATASNDSNASNVSPWIAAAAGYQQLYSRATVARVEPDMPVTAATVSDIRRDDDLAVEIPDLSKQGLTFKRIQRLRWHDKPLVQIVYLPAQGAPVALCMMKAQQADAMPTGGRVDSLDVVSWRRGGLSYALLGEHGSVDLDGLGKQLYQGNATSLSRNETEVRADAG